MKNSIKLIFAIHYSLFTIHCHAQYKLTYSDTLMLIGEQMYKQKDLMGAIINLDSCIQLNPRNDQCRYTRGKIAYDMKNFELAKKLFKSVLALTERDAVSWSMLGLCFQELKQYDSAEFCFKNAVKANPDESRFFANWGKNEYLQGKYDHAEQLYNTAVFLKPDYSNHLKNRAEVRIKMGKKKEAIEDLKKAAEAEPNDADINKKLEEIEGRNYNSMAGFVLSFILVIGGLLWYKKKKVTRDL